MVSLNRVVFCIVLAIPFCAHSQDESTLDEFGVLETLSEDGDQEELLRLEKPPEITPPESASTELVPTEPAPTEITPLETSPPETSPPEIAPNRVQRIGQQLNPQRIRLKSLVSDAMAANFLQGRPIVVRVPAPSRTVKSILLYKQNSFKAEPVRVRSNTQIQGGQLIVPVHRSVIERLDYQPIRIGLFQSNVSVIRLVPTNQMMPGLESIALLRKRSIHQNYYLRLKPDNGVAVAFKGYKNFRLSNDSFDVQLPFSQIAAIFFDVEEPGTVNITLRNGNTVSGRHDWPESVNFETPWGDELIEVERIVSLAKDPSVRVVPSGTDSPRWILTRQQ